MNSTKHSVQIDELVASLYRTILWRDPDPTGLSHYTALITQGSSLESIIREFLTSPERQHNLDKSGETMPAQDFDLEALIAEAEAKAASIKSPAEAIAAYPPVTWFHSFVLSDGTRIESTIKTFDALQVEFEVLFSGVDLAGASVLDVGSFDGAFAFEAKKLGAARVLATDYWTWTYPGQRVLERFLYVRRDLGIDIDYRMIDIPDISVSTVGQFDIVLFMGVFYHLREPITIVDRLGLITKDLVILETHLDLEDVPHPAMRHYPGSEMVGDPTTWWGPNRACIESLLEHAGFRDIRFTRHPWGPRGIFQAKK